MQAEKLLQQKGSGNDTLLVTTWNKLGDHHADRQDWHQVGMHQVFCLYLYLLHVYCMSVTCMSVACMSACLLSVAVSFCLPVCSCVFLCVSQSVSVSGWHCSSVRFSICQSVCSSISVALTAWLGVAVVSRSVKEAEQAPLCGT